MKTRQARSLLAAAVAIAAICTAAPVRDASSQAARSPSPSFVA